MRASTINSPATARTAARALAVAVLLVALPLSACNGHRPLAGVAPAAFAGQQVEEIALDLPADRGGLSRSGRAALRDFLAHYRAEGHGPLVVRAPTGAADAGAYAVVGEIRQEAGAQGIPPAAVAVATFPSKSPHAPVTLSYQRLLAAGPCAIGDHNLAGDWRNLTPEGFGCITDRNLAAMIEDPADLYRPRAQTPRDAMRRDEVFGRYRVGEDTSWRTATDQAGAASALGN